jgi:hypothetical protein
VRADVEEMTTMRAVILYESLFGNTAAIAQSVARGLREARPDAFVDCRGVDNSGALPDDVDLVVLEGLIRLRRTKPSRGTNTLLGAHPVHQGQHGAPVRAADHAR